MKLSLDLALVGRFGSFWPDTTRKRPPNSKRRSSAKFLRVNGFMQDRAVIKGQCEANEVMKMRVVAAKAVIEGNN